MKTQIKSLINGSMNVRRDLSAAKYINKYDNKTKTVKGSSFVEREEIARRVIRENPSYMDIEICGCRLHLVRLNSASGKTIWYITKLSPKEFQLIVGHPYPSGNNWESSLVINCDMTVEVLRWVRRNENQKWVEMGDTLIGEEFVTIL